MSAYRAWCALVLRVAVTEHVVERVLRETQVSLHARPARAQAVNAFSIIAEAGDMSTGAVEAGT